MLYLVSEVRRFISGLDHPEGVAVSRKGEVYCGGEGGQLYRIAPDATRIEVVARTGGFCLGVTLDREENVIVCDCGRREVLKVTAQGKMTLVSSSVDGRKFLNPNFSVFDSNDNLYFSDSGEWSHANGIIFRIRNTGQPEVFAPGPFHFANGLALDAAERYLYVVESNLDRVLRIPIGSDGAAGLPEVFVEGMAHVPDGLAFDADQNLYVTTYASNSIFRVAPDRSVSLLCRDQDNVLLCQPTNCAFGGPDFDQLLVANLGRDHLSILDLKRRGQALRCHRNTA
ncbi:MAG TPA: SMP-30/gluconolactonase/LRE family protein [Terriglobia bacterium]|nr:SMP-30/gluconolactonase/LRE family protein [Terriglobia bacterium]